MAEFAKLQNKFEQIPAPAPRYDSQIVPLLPKGTTFFLSIPNFGQTLGEANQIFQQQLQQSPVLQQWWASQNKSKQGPSMDKVIAELQALSQYLGDEIVVASDPQDFGPNSGLVVLAAVKSSGLKEFLETDFGKILTDKNGQDASARGGTATALADRWSVARSAGAGSSGNVGDEHQSSALQQMNAQLDAGASGFTSTELGTGSCLLTVRGAGFLLAADLQTIAQENHPGASAEHEAATEASGLHDMRYLVLEHREINNQPDNRAVLEFANERRGIASWLAAPAPMRSLEYVSANAGMVVSFISKNPTAIYDDVINMTGGDASAQQHLAEAEAELNLKIRDDIAATLGGDITIALDGPVLPTPSWKVVAEVYDAPRLQNSLQQLVNVINRHAAEHGHSGVKLDQETVSGRTFYRVQSSRQLSIRRRITHSLTASSSWRRRGPW